jgi:Kef-type K+ transport system membrane component KefB
MFGGLLEALTQLPLLARFALAMAVILIVPALCEKIGLPAVVGLLLAGVVFGPHGLNVGPKSHEVAHFFADVGKLLLMFFAGLEIDLVQFRRTGHRSLVFGLATFTLPLASGILVGLGFGYGWLGALLIGSLLASHTLLGYPIVQRLGLSRDEAVTVTVGATIFTDVASLMILAVCIPIHSAGFSPKAFLLQLAQLAVYVPLVLFGLGALTRWLPPQVKSKEGQFLVMLLVVVLAAIGAEAIHLEGIIGAFLAGLALNQAAQESRAKYELEFLGNTLFVPMFFITVGFLIDLRVFATTLASHLGLVVAIVGGLIASKLLAALLTRRAFGYSRDQGLIMWSLSLPQVAATLAAALVAFEAQDAEGRRLIDEPVLNGVIVLMVVNSVLGPILTEQFGKRLASGSKPASPPRLRWPRLRHDRRVLGLSEAPRESPDRWPRHGILRSTRSTRAHG